MIDEDDIEFIKSARQEIRRNRESDITLRIRKKVGSHPVTDEDIFENFDYELPAVVTVVTSSTGNTGNSNSYFDILKIVTGDIVVDIDLDDIDALPKESHGGEFDMITYDEVRYKVKSFGVLGMIERGRLEILGGRTF